MSPLCLLGRSFEVLLVEDSPADARLFELALTESGVASHLHTVADATEAMRFLRPGGAQASARCPDLIFLDLNLPGKSGRELLADLKADEELRLIPVVILTSSSAEEDISECYGRNANCFVTKPVQFDDFTWVVQALLRFWHEIAELPSAQGGGAPLGRPAERNAALR